MRKLGLTMSDETNENANWCALGTSRVFDIFGQ